MNSLSLKVLICIPVILLISCGLPQINKEAPEINELKLNNKFRINLPEDHRTGYMWQLNPDFDKGKINNLGPVWHGNEKGVDFNLEATAAGQTTLTFVLRKHTDTTDVKNFIIKIVDN